MQEEKTQKLRARLRNLLDAEKQKDTRKRIEQLSESLLGENHFAYNNSGTADNIAEHLSIADKDKLKEFIDGVVKIRDEVETDHYFALKSLIGEDA